MQPTGAPDDDFARGRDLLLRHHRPADALPLLQQAARAQPQDAMRVHVLATCLQNLARHGEAVRVYDAAVRRLPGDDGLQVGRGRALMLANQRDAAAEVLAAIVARTPARADAAGLLALLLREAGDADAACAVIEPAVAAAPAHPDLAWEYAQDLFYAERYDAAERQYVHHAALRPGHALSQVALGRIAGVRGDAALARSRFTAALQMDADNAPAWWEYASASGFALEPAQRERVAALRGRVASLFHRALLDDVLARSADRAGDIDAAIAHSLAANRAHAAHLAAQGTVYAPDAHVREVDGLIDSYTATRIAELRDAGDPDPCPVFVFGLPRSGTTLVEQLLAAHPRIRGVGEQVFARRALLRLLDARVDEHDPLQRSAIRATAAQHLDQLRARALRLDARDPGARIVDKLPDNYLLAGWIAIEFPDATLIHCRRDPRDIALSCWQAQFAQLHWSFDLDHIAHRIEQHARLLRHWRAVLGPRLVEVRYDDVVDDVEAAARRLVAATGLDWDAAVLGFDRRGGAVRSASQMQVREPVHRRGLGRWQRYRAVLAPVQARLDAVAAADGYPLSDD